MKNYVSGWRRGTPRPAATADAPTKRPELVEPTPAPIVKPKRARPAPRQEVIDAPEAPRPVRAFVVPSIGIPRAPIRWFYLVGALFLLKVSTDATHDLATYVRAWQVDNLWWYCLGAQVIISSVERAFFVGNRNKFTGGVFLIDSLIVGVGLGLSILPGLFASPVWAFLSSGNGLAGYAYDPATLSGKALALAVGAFIAWGGDALFDLAMKG